jgi:hypothetical protein
VEIWDPVTGAQRSVTNSKQENGYTTIPLQFAPFQSFFIVFKKTQNKKPAYTISSYTVVQELTGPWTVHFDKEWGGPSSIVFDQLEDWTKRPEEGIRFYSGTATYVKQFDAPKTNGKKYWLHLGTVKNIADIKLNGKSLGIVWTSPWQVDITHALQPAGNKLEIEIINCWPNRLIGDAALPPEKRKTHTNIKFKPDTPLMSSGLLGPVTIQVEG